MRNLLIFIILLFFLTYVNPDIFFNPIDKTILYNNFEGELYPFLNTTKRITLDNNTALKLLEEYNFDNCFFNDVLKVEVVEGNYKGEIGYVLEDEVEINKLSVKNNEKIFFKDDTHIDLYKLNIPKDTRCEIINSRIENKTEILTLKIISGIMKNTVIECSLKNKIHYIVNKKTEILYFTRNGFNAIKIISSDNLFEIENAEFKNSRSDQDGFIYIDVNINYAIIRKEGYTDGIIKNDSLINLCFMNKLDFVKYYDDRSSVYKNGIYEFEIRSRNYGVKDEIGVSVISDNDLSVFAYPEFDCLNYRIIGGFFIKKPNESIQVDSTIKFSRKGAVFFYYDYGLKTWINQNIFELNGKYKASDIKGGFYILAEKKSNGEKNDNLKINDINKMNISNLFFRNNNGEFYIKNFLNDMRLSFNRYECFFLSLEEPFKVNSIIIDFNEINRSANLFLSDIKSKDEGVNELKRELLLKNFFKKYKGRWNRYAAKRDNSVITEINKNFEFLGDMELVEPDKIIFKNNTLIIEGIIELVDSKKLNIKIVNFNGILKSKFDDYFYKINPSLFSSQLIIPCYYQFYQGIMELDFDGVFFIRRNIYNDNPEKYLLIEGNYFLFTDYPESAEKSKYKLYFSYN
jgi:hypothetical protein